MPTPVRSNVILTSTGHIPTQPERSPMLSFYLASCSAEGRPVPLPTRPCPPPQSSPTVRAARLPAIVGPRRQHPPTAPIDARDRVESGSPLPRRLTVAIP
jgi:hypothetical protein